ncbi:glycine rich domain-containing protein [Clostridium saccharoperbutylacetonicum]
MLKTIAFNYTGVAQTWTIPTHVSKFFVRCYGSQGGIGIYSNSQPGGKGGVAEGTYILKSNDARTVYIYVGAQNGYNGGGVGNAWAGGGASDVRINGINLVNRIIVAGGGGGGSDRFIGGNGGGLIGSDGSNYYSSWCAKGGTQIDGGSGYGKGSLGIGGMGQGNRYNYGEWVCGGGGGGYYGGGGGIIGTVYTSVEPGGGAGGSSYIALLDPIDASTTSGVRTGNGLVEITYEEDPNAYFLEKDDKYYVIDKKYFDNINKIFLPVEIEDIYNDLVDTAITPRADMSITSMLKPFVLDNQTYDPIKLIDFKEYKLCTLSKDNLYKMTMHYTASNKALSMTNIKIKEKYILDNYRTNANDSIFFLDIKATDKTKIDYFFDYGETKSYKNCSILNTDKISNNFYFDFKLNSVDSLLQSVTLYGKNNDKYVKLKEPSINVYDKFIKFNDNYDEVIVNEICRKSIEYTINTLDKF